MFCALLGRFFGRWLHDALARRRCRLCAWLPNRACVEIPGPRPQLHLPSQSGRRGCAAARGWRFAKHHKSEVVGSGIYSTTYRTGVPTCHLGRAAKRNGQIFVQACPISWWSCCRPRDLHRDLHTQGQREEHDQDGVSGFCWLQWHQAGGWTTLSLVVRSSHSAEVAARRPRGADDPRTVAPVRIPTNAYSWPWQGALGGDTHRT